MDLRHHAVPKMTISNIIPDNFIRKENKRMRKILKNVRRYSSIVEMNYNIGGLCLTFDKTFDMPIDIIVIIIVIIYMMK